MVALFRFWRDIYSWCRLFLFNIVELLWCRLDVASLFWWFGTNRQSLFWRFRGGTDWLGCIDGFGWPSGRWRRPIGRISGTEYFCESWGRVAHARSNRHSDRYSIVVRIPGYANVVGCDFRTAKSGLLAWLVDYGRRSWRLTSSYNPGTRSLFRTPLAVRMSIRSAADSSSPTYNSTTVDSEPFFFAPRTTSPRRGCPPFLYGVRISCPHDYGIVIER